MEKRHYSKETVYFIAYARLSHSIPAGKVLDFVGVGLIINKVSGIIEDTSCTLLTDEAKYFINDICLGFNLHDDAIDNLLHEITERYHGMSQKSICVAIKGAYDRYITWKNE